jgi:hypothetical protein
VAASGVTDADGCVDSPRSSHFSRLISANFETAHIHFFVLMLEQFEMSVLEWNRHNITEIFN